MPKINTNRIDRLEKEIEAIPDRLTEEPRAAGKPRCVYITECNDWSRAMLKRPGITEAEKQKLQEHIELGEKALQGKTRVEVYQEYEAYLEKHLAGTWGNEPAGREYLLLTLAECRKNLKEAKAKN